MRGNKLEGRLREAKRTVAKETRKRWDNHEFESQQACNTLAQAIRGQSVCSKVWRGSKGVFWGFWGGFREDLGSLEHSGTGPPLLDRGLNS